MTRSNLFCSAHANVPVLSPTSVFLVFINEVTNASRRVITWPRDSHKRELLLLVPDSRAKRLKKKKNVEETSREHEKGKRGQERKKESATKWTSTRNYPPWRPGTRPIYKNGEIACWQGRVACRQGHRGSCARPGRYGWNVCLVGCN